MSEAVTKHIGHPKVNLCDSNTTLEELKDIYGEWAKDYEKGLEDLGFNGYKVSSKILHEHLIKKHDTPYKLRILDVGAGTGVVGEELYNFGYKDIHALDASAEMLQVAATKNIYKSLIVAYLGCKPTSEKNEDSKKDGSYFTVMSGASETALPEKEYDATICCGCFTFGHIKGDGFDDLVRMTKPGGLTCFTIRTCAMSEATLGYQVKIDQLINDKRWKLISKTEENYYIPQNSQFEAKNCYVFVFEIL